MLSELFGVITEEKRFSARVMKYEGFGYFSHSIYIEQIYLHTAALKNKHK